MSKMTDHGFGSQTCDACGKFENYCPECSTCHACLEAQDKAAVAKLQIQSQALQELLEVVEAQQQWIDGVPAETPLPTMVGFDRDWADAAIVSAKELVK